jgi:hypothetical protein
MADTAIKDEDMHDELREHGNSRDNNVHRSNGARGLSSSVVGRKGARFGSYYSWTVLELRARAKELGITGYSGLNKSDLISELRNH